jgi:hypothetical protein
MLPNVLLYRSLPLIQQLGVTSSKILKHQSSSFSSRKLKALVDVLEVGVAAVQIEYFF